jgi:protoheme IX farnesyltransferase
MITRNGVMTRVGTIRDHIELTKPRIVFLVVLTTIAGFYLGAHGALDIPLLLHTAIGTALVVSSANSLNQLMEREADGRMRRTENRPLPAGRMDAYEALAWGMGTIIVGFSYLFVGVGALTAFVAFMAWAAYVFVYTPLKKKTSLSTPVGAVPGALPPVIGWVAARGGLTIEAVALFLILFLWQLPHFLAIGWMYRDDYARGGFPMLPVIDTDGTQTGRQIVVWGLALVPVSLLPSVIGLTGGLYFVGAIILGLGFLVFGVRTAVHKSVSAARALFIASLLFLPALFGLMMLDKIR